MTIDGGLTIFHKTNNGHVMSVKGTIANAIYQGYVEDERWRPTKQWRCKGMDSVELEWDVEGAKGPCGLEKACQSCCLNGPRSCLWHSRFEKLQPVLRCVMWTLKRRPLRPLKPGVHTNDFAPIHGRRARIHTAPEEDNTSNQQSTPQVLCEYGRGDRESGRNR